MAFYVRSRFNWQVAADELIEAQQLLFPGMRRRPGERSRAVRTTQKAKKHQSPQQRYKALADDLRVLLNKRQRSSSDETRKRIDVELDAVRAEVKKIRALLKR